MNRKSSQFCLQGEGAVTGSTFRKRVGERTPWSWWAESWYTIRLIRKFLR